VACFSWPDGQMLLLKQDLRQVLFNDGGSLNIFLFQVHSLVHEALDRFLQAPYAAP
jgi:hypothetical protein